MHHREVGHAAQSVSALPLDDAKWQKIARDMGLSPRHKQVIELILRGKQDKEIASELGLSLATVRTYLGRLFQRLAVDDRMHLVLKIFAASHDRCSPGGSHRR